jgi:hypothetical protein
MNFKGVAMNFKGGAMNFKGVAMNFKAGLMQERCTLELSPRCHTLWRPSPWSRSTK